MSYAKKRSASFIDDSDASSPPAAQVSKKTKKTGSASPAGEDDDGNPYWDLSNKRRVGISNFKNMCFVNIREFYEKDSRLLPGKKGISLSVEQYAALLKAVPGINAALKKQGHNVEDADMNDAPEVPVKSKTVKKERKSSKANIEATSDEEEDD